MGKRVLVLLVMLVIFGSSLALATLDGGPVEEPTYDHGPLSEGGLMDEVNADTTAPTIGPDTTPDFIGTGETLKFEVTISDDYGVKNASVDYFTATTSLSKVPLNLETGDNKTGVYTQSVTAPLNALDPILYTIYATDDSNNTNFTTGSVGVRDTRKPWIDDYTWWYSKATTGDAFSFYVNVTENVGISEVRVAYTIGSPPWVSDNTTMTPVDTVNGIGTYIHTITVPTNSTTAILYSTMAWDTRNNFFIRNDQANVTDNDRPGVGKDNSDTSATTGDPVHMEVEVTDNVAVATGGVRLNYQLEGEALKNVSMNAKQVNPLGIGSYQYVITVPEYYVGPINYTFSVRDTSSNWNSSRMATIDATDNDPPVVGPDTSYAEGDDRFEFRVNVTDNVAVASVKVNFTISGREPAEYLMSPIDVDANNSGLYGGVGVDIPQDIQVRLDYTFTATDTAGRTRSLSGVFTSKDDEPPVLGEDGTWGEPVKGGSMTLWVLVTDNIGLKEVKVEYWFGSGTHGTDVMTNEGDGLFNHTIQLPRWPVGNLTYVFHAWDLKGNQNSSEERQLVPYNLLPELATGWVWNVTEEETEVLDLTPYLNDGNDAVTSLAITTEAPNVTAQGRKLTLYYDEWMEDHTIEIGISDGEDTATAYVSVHVLNVNDPPVITSDPSSEGEVGVEYRYQVTYFDMDVGETQEFSLDRAPAGMTVTASGLVTWTPTMDQEGGNSVDLVIRDSSTEVHQSWTVLVTGLPNRAPSFTNSPPTTHSAGTPYQWDAEASDPDGDTLSFSITSGPDDATIDAATGLLEWDPVVDRRDTTANFDFVVRVSDGPHSADLPFTVAVTFPANQAPLIKAGLGNIDVTAKKSVDLTEYMSDPDDAVRDLEWNVTSTSGKFVVRMHDNFLVIEPKKDTKGKGTVTLTLKDPWGLSDSQDITVTVDTEEEAQGGLGTTTLFMIIVAVIVVAGLIYIFKDRLTEGKGPSPGTEEEEEGKE